MLYTWKQFSVASEEKQENDCVNRKRNWNNKFAKDDNLKNIFINGNRNIKNLVVELEAAVEILKSVQKDHLKCIVSHTMQIISVSQAGGRRREEAQNRGRGRIEN